MVMQLLGLTFAEFQAWAQPTIGHTPRVHGALYRQLMHDGVLIPGSSSVGAQLSAALCARVQSEAPASELPGLVSSQTSPPDEGSPTRKYVLRLADGLLVETVVIPMRGGRHHTVCVSSQVGCRMGCSFCHTARMGLSRNLAAHEIVGQVIAVSRLAGCTPRNVVFMGMGEPLDNALAVAKAVRILCEPRGLAIAPRHITISSVGRGEVLERWHELGLGAVNLAISLGAADDALRSELMPINRSVDLTRLRQILGGMRLRTNQRILLSYIVIPGVNDQPQQIARLIAWSAGLPALVNLIAYNPIPSRPWRAPTPGELERVRLQLADAQVPVRLRATHGRSVMAACGQLGDPARRRPRPEPSALA